MLDPRVVLLHPPIVHVPALDGDCSTSTLASATDDDDSNNYGISNVD